MTHVQLISSMGSDETIVQSARMSTSSQGKTWEEGGERLLGYLWRNKHLGPFEFVAMTCELTVPMFVARQIMRHRTFAYNEASARYSEVGCGYYAPQAWRVQSGAGNKQSSEGSLAGIWELTANQIYAEAADHARRAYEDLLRLGVAREQARMVLPQSTWTTFRMTGNLRNWLHFLSLRTHEGAQAETRVVAEELSEIVKQVAPKTWELWRGTH